MGPARQALRQVAARTVRRRTEQVEVGVSVGLQASPEALVKTVRKYLEQGYARVKIKIKPGRDVGEPLAVRRPSRNLRLQVDANSAYHPGDRAGAQAAG